MVISKLCNYGNLSDAIKKTEIPIFTNMEQNLIK